MRNVLCFALLLPVLALAAGNMQPVTALAPENGQNGGPAVQIDNGNRTSPKAPVFEVGRVDTVGGTTYDWWANGPIYRFLVNAPTFGLHVLWMYSADQASTNFLDRNMRYNYYDFAAGAWSWIDPDYMQSGQNVFAERSGYGNIDFDPLTGVAIVGRHTASQTPAPMHPDAARDIAPGAGIFEYAEGTPGLDGYQWPPLSVGQNSTIHMFCITPTYSLAYSRVVTWPTFDPLVSGFYPDPGFPTHNIAASKMSQKVCVTLENSLVVPEDAYYSVSDDGGTTWPSSPTQMLPPVAFEGDTVTSFHISSIFPFYDKDDQLHIVASVMPYVNDTGYIIPAEIWHWCAANSPEWTEVHRAGCDPVNLQAPVGYNAIYATRPSIGQANNGDLFVAWEQFDSANVEPTTQFLRADIFAASSGDNGVTWRPAVKLTEAGTTTCRFPSVIDKITTDRMIPVLYLNDDIAGMFVQGQGAATNCRALVQWIPDTAIGIFDTTGIAERPSTPPTRFELSALPNPASRRTQISYAMPRAGEVSLVVYDAAGRPVQTLASGRRGTGRYSATWDASRTAAGVYFYTLNTDETSITKKLIVAH